MSPPAPQTTDLLTVRNISKRFGITQALDDVSVTFRAGEVHALMGENGAGKSTLGKVISGLHKQDEGVVTIGLDGGGHELKPGSIDDAFHHGIRIVHQELAQCPNLTVAENLCLHDLPRTRFGTIDERAMTERAARLLSKLEPGIDVRAKLGTLSPGHRQIVQIAASLDEGGGKGQGHAARVIVFDEPTSSLSIAEVERLLTIIRKLAREDGITCIYVSHRMGEIFAVCDRVSVLRDGKFVATSEIQPPSLPSLPSGGVTIDEATLVEQMIGRKVGPTLRRDSTHDAASAPLLEVRNLSSPGKVAGVSLAIRAGEILGIGGLVGAGRSELLDALFGLDPHAHGTVIANGKELCIPAETNGRGVGGHLGPRASIAAGIGYVPEDRKLQGLFFLLGVGENIVEPFMPRLARMLGLRNMAAETRLIDDRLRSFQVKVGGAGRAALPGSLSGGNQQKLLIARWMGEGTRILLLDEPTRGIDVGTKAEVYRLVRAAADQGLAVLLVSSEMPELLALSDRIIVLSEGRMTGELRGEAEMTQEKILRLATAGH